MKPRRFASETIRSIRDWSTGFDINVLATSLLKDKRLRALFTQECSDQTEDGSTENLKIPASLISSCIAGRQTTQGGQFLGTDKARGDIDP